MKLLGWVRFWWDLSNLPPPLSQLPQHYQIAYATSEDEIGLRKVFSSSFMLDPVWNPVGARDYANGEQLGRPRSCLRP